MTSKHDPVDNALESLGGRQWPQEFDNNQLKDRIMQDFQSKRSNSRFGGRGVLVALLAIGTLGMTGFAAAGGLDLVQTWFITAEVNGEPVELDGAEVTVVTEGNTSTITVDNIEGDFEEGEEVTITATNDGSGAGAQVKTVNVIPTAKTSDKDD